jgi:hypothetical protein
MRSPYNANSGIKLPGLGRLMETEVTINDYTANPEYTPVTPRYIEGGGDGGIVDVPYEEVSSTPKSVDDTAITPLPVFNTMTSSSSCIDCNADATSSSAVATTSVTNATVTPLPAAPSTFNWLLVLGVAAVGFIAYKSSSTPGLAGLLEPQVEPKTLGRTPRKRPAAPTGHVKELVID